ncbi:MAG: 16S rRNA (uracil(1498)-N(3))-methyltransferase [Bacteroidetes bacterium]|jgi:16S rRNA (uracil1498-N3)-methyltransferase|nr:16S rRNA (uracil(1498)-N(3))-methyltransferase [Bacteroidota bacterium]
MALPDIPCFLDSDFQNDKELNRLPYTESQHAVKVLRMTEGDPFLVSTGHGTLWECRVKNNRLKQLVYEPVNDWTAETGPPPLHSVACGVLSHNTTMEWMVEKLVEIGVKAIYMVHTDRSNKKKVNMDRLGKMAVGALKQSRKAYLPKIHDVALEQLFKSNKGPYLVATCHALDLPLLWNSDQGTAQTVFIGPEGDFSDRELEFLQKKNCTFVSLGPQRLRSETAAILALTSLNIKTY